MYKDFFFEGAGVRSLKSKKTADPEAPFNPNALGDNASDVDLVRSRVPYFTGTHPRRRSSGCLYAPPEQLGCVVLPGSEHYFTSALVCVVFPTARPTSGCCWGCRGRGRRAG
jgi:hypothetical protein